jgi:hypothetical protein
MALERFSIELKTGFTVGAKRFIIVIWIFPIGILILRPIEELIDPIYQQEIIG